MQSRCQIWGRLAYPFDALHYFRLFGRWFGGGGRAPRLGGSDASLWSGTSSGCQRCVCRGPRHSPNEHIRFGTNSRNFEILGGYPLVPFDPSPKIFPRLDGPRVPGSNEVSHVQIRRRLTPQSQFPIFWGVSRKPRGRPTSNPHNIFSQPAKTSRDGSADPDGPGAQRPTVRFLPARTV